MASLAPVRHASITALVLAAAAAGCGDSDSTDSAPSTVSVTAPAEATVPAESSESEVPPDDSAGEPAEADEPGADRPRAVADVVTAVLTGSETPETICDALVTAKFVTEAYGARQGCLAAQHPGSLAGSVEVTDVQESGTEATAVAVPKGGPYDGVEVEVELVPATDLGDAWVIDSLFADVPAGP
jgi:hypothetical protein